MGESINRDLKISIMVGMAAGLLLLPTLKNLGVDLNLFYGLISFLGLTAFTPAGYLVGYFASKRWPSALQFVKFGISGGLSAMVDFGLMNVLILLSGMASGVWFVVFKSISVIGGITNSYLFNKHWTFQAGASGGGLWEFLKFLVMALISFGLNVGIASVMVNVLGAPENITPATWANISAASAAIVILFWNYTWMRFLVFKKPVSENI